VGGGETVIVAGIGCRKGCPAEEIVALVEYAAGLSGCEPAFLAAPDFKADEPGLQGAAFLLGLKLLSVAPADLAAAQPRCLTHSARAQTATGTSSVAEGSALAAAGPDSRLRLARIASASATCAIAVSA
jgi:cobalt-precorrin 5A hydrolase